MPCGSVMEPLPVCTAHLQPQPLCVMHVQHTFFRRAATELHISAVMPPLVGLFPEPPL